jgi:hypothetical protein
MRNSSTRSTRIWFATPMLKRLFSRLSCVLMPSVVTFSDPVRFPLMFAPTTPACVVIRS